MEAIKEKLIEWAKEYNSTSFIENDPIQFPRKYREMQDDAEISGLLTALISFGNRKQIIKKADELDKMFKGNPFYWIANGEFFDDIPYNNDSFYRTITNRRMIDWCVSIRRMITKCGTIENYLMTEDTPIDKTYETLSNIMGFSPKSANKRIAMFMRWMVRDDGIVDLGLWRRMSSKDLIIPLDTHVHKMALELEITKRKTTDLKTAMEITDYMKTVFPDDPLLGDFALFGYGVNRGKEDGNAL